MIGLAAFLKTNTETRRERLARGQCGRCGYDLTGNVSGVCPECGTRRA
jgi:rubrerythrin